jgi:hypothetical protein
VRTASSKSARRQGRSSSPSRVSGSADKEVPSIRLMEGTSVLRISYEELPFEAALASASAPFSEPPMEDVAEPAD